MPPPLRVAQWLDENFQKPHVDPEWLEGCTEWLEEDQNISPVSAFSEFVERVKGQLLESDLLDSMLPGTGLDVHISNWSGYLGGPPVLVQINAITEIGASAFQLEQIRSAREERILAGVGDEEGEDDGDVEVEGEGPMPKYPRSALRLQLTDGTTFIEAMEYRRIPQFVLGKTPLGFKLQLKGTRFQNGMAMLEPATIILLGGKQAELEANQIKDFKRGLYARLGRPLIPIPNDGEQVEENRNNLPVPVPAPTVTRTPLRDISPPPLSASVAQHDDDIEMAPRRRLPTSSSLNDTPSALSELAKQSRPAIPLPSRQNKTSTDVISDSRSVQPQRRVPMAEKATLVFAGSQATINTTSAYFNRSPVASGSGSNQLQSSEINIAVDNLDLDFEPTGRQLSRTLPSPDYFQSSEPSVDNDAFDFDFLDEMDQENHPPSLPDQGKAREGLAVTLCDDLSDDYGMDDSNDLDPAFLEECAKIERNAILKGGVVNSSAPTIVSASNTGSGSSLSVPPVPDASLLSTGAVPRTVDVIEIYDSDDSVLEPDDKENEPVASRHVRRRTDATAVKTQPSVSQNYRGQNANRKTGQPIVLATNPDDIIDLSDSD